jgi:tetratricopeptide (TPR) repeat protein
MLDHPTVTFEAARQAFVSNDLASAEQLCRAIVTAEPKNVLPWTLLCEIALRRNDGRTALSCAEQAVRLDPNHLLARVVHAKTCLILGDLAAALETAEAGERIGNAPAEALDGLGAIFGMLGRHRKALDLFRRAVAARPGMPQFLFNLAATERMLGALAESETHCDTAIARDRHHYLTHYLRSDLREQTQAHNHIAEMETIIRDGARHWQGEVLLRFALSKEYDDLGDHANSFRQIKAGADLQRRNMDYDVRADIAIIDHAINTQTSSWLTSLPPGYRDAEPIFVVGLPRSGTTVVERIVASHSAIVSAGETGVFPMQIARAMREPARAFNLNPAETGRRYVETAAVLAAGNASRSLDKTLQNYLCCGFIHTALPRAKIILVRRHPLDTCFALYRAHFQGTFRFSYELAELGEYYLAFRRLARHWQSILPAGAFLEISYDDIVRDQQGESRRIMEFLNLPWEDRVLRFHESSAPSATASAVQIRRPLYSSSIGKWRRHAKELKPLREILAREISDDELS